MRNNPIPTNDAPVLDSPLTVIPRPVVAIWEHLEQIEGLLTYSPIKAVTATYIQKRLDGVRQELGREYPGLVGR